MTKEYIWMVGKRFLKAFLFAGIASTLVVMATNPLTDLSQFKGWISILVTAFLTGGFMGVEKALQSTN